MLLQSARYKSFVLWFESAAQHDDDFWCGAVADRVERGTLVPVDSLLDQYCKEHGNEHTIMIPEKDMRLGLPETLQGQLGSP